MNLSEVSILIGQSAADIEMARDVFTSDTRRFVEAILEETTRSRQDPWTSARVKIELPREIETESKVTSLRGQRALARAELQFKKKTQFRVIAEVPFGIAFDQKEQSFRWQIDLVPDARYLRLDEKVWSSWEGKVGSLPPGSTHEDKTNTVRFVSRTLTADLTVEIAFSDLKTVLEFLLSSHEALADAVGVDLGPADEISSGT